MNNYKRIEQIKETILDELTTAWSSGTNCADELEELADTITDQEVERLVIYYADCWAICQEAQKSDFEIEQTGETAENICQLAFWTLLELFVDAYDSRELVNQVLKDNE
tara:strand:- start:167 stop:493 length:327 start_codon:yes stop_codon:yes gene_type:complete